MGLPKDRHWKSSHILPGDFSTKSNSMLINQLISKNGGRRKGITTLEKDTNSSPEKLSNSNNRDTRSGVVLKSTEGKLTHSGWRSSDLASAI